MRAIKFTSQRFYIRKDIDAGWTLAIWKWRFFFNIIG